MDVEREKDIQNLCKQVLEMSPRYYPTSSRSRSDYSCPFCYEESGDSMDTIQHKGNCAYLIAKDLSTNL